MKIARYIVITFLIFILAACASNETTSEQRQQFYRESAERNDRLAEDWRNRNIHYMADYHEGEAHIDRHNGFAEGCGVAETILFDILIGSDACQYKH